MNNIETNSTQAEFKVVPFNITETKEIDRNGTKYGIVEGYASTYGNVDRVGDVVDKGAFTNTIIEHRKNSRPIRMYYQHDSKAIIGGFSPFTITDDQNGLKVVGEINLEVQQGREAYALAKQGVLTDFSIGYNVVDSEMVNGVRHLKEVVLWEISLVSEPANPKATVTQVKATPAFKDYELAPIDTPWDPEGAGERVKDLMGVESVPNVDYKNAFFFCDRENVHSLAGYKLPFLDVIDGKLMAIPKAIEQAAGALVVARCDLEIPQQDLNAVKNHINKYYKKLGMESPLEILTVDSLKSTIQSKRDVEAFLRDSGLSRSVSLYLTSLIDETKLIPVGEQSSELDLGGENQETVNTTQCDAVVSERALPEVKQSLKKAKLLGNLKSLIEKL